jgi:hypothetical protein
MAQLDWGNVTRNVGELNTSLCYKLEWGVGLLAGFRPISGMPSQHPMVDGTINCPANLSIGFPGAPMGVGIPIPAQGTWWTVQGRYAYRGCDNLQPVVGAVMFYGFAYPDMASVNTGYHRSDSMMMYMIVDTNSDVYLVVTIDKVNTRGDTSGGEMALDVSTSPAMSGIQLVQLDDTLEYSRQWSRATDPSRNWVTYPQWDASIGQGSFYWRWGACCTDGMILGPMPTVGFEITLNSLYNRNIGTLALATWIPDTSNISFIDLPMSAINGAPSSSSLKIGVSELSETRTLRGVPRIRRRRDGVPIGSRRAGFHMHRFLHVVHKLRPVHLHSPLWLVRREW